MSYVHDGTHHWDAIASEKEFVDWLNDGGHKHFKFGEKEFSIAEKRGGTKYTEDAVAVMTDDTEVKFSLKLAKEGMKKSSFTFLNTTKIFHTIKKEGEWLGLNMDAIQPLLSMEDYRDTELENLPKIQRLKKKDEYTSYMNDACMKTLQQFSGQKELTGFLESIISHYEEIDYVVHIDRVKNTLYWYRPSDHPLFHHLKLEYLPFAWFPALTGPRQKGFHIGLRKDSDILHLDLRLRLHYNNGVSAFFKMGNSNNNAYPCFKLQQDTGSLPGMLWFIEKHGGLHRVKFIPPNGK